MTGIVDFAEDCSSNSDLFDCEFTSVDAVINEATVFTGFCERQTENGIRTLIAYGEGSGRSAFFTDSSALKQVVCDPARVFPFRATIKVVRYGAMTGFKFFAPATPITLDDKDNFEFYKRGKHRRNR